MVKSIKCPRIGCDGVGIPADTKKKFSLGKAIVGSMVGLTLVGSVGGMVGAAAGINGKNGKTTFVCSKCGKVFEKKICF
jgi:hypothetical protein